MTFPNNPVRRTMLKVKNKTTAVLVALVIVLALIGGFFSYKYWQTTQNDPERQAKELLDYVSTIADVPSSETPTVATVTDTSKLSNQTLQMRSQNGDKLLIYSKAKRLILYRPSSKKIIETLTIEDQRRADVEADKTPSAATTLSPTTWHYTTLGSVNDHYI